MFLREPQSPKNNRKTTVPHFDTIWGLSFGVCQRHMPIFLPPPADPLLRKFAPKIRPKMGFEAWRWRGAQWPETLGAENSVFGASRCGGVCK